VILLPLPLMDRHTFSYSPYPSLNLPVFDPLIGVGLLGLLGPAIASGGGQASHARPPQSIGSERDA
jgi:hypothetical protein